jgi:hypothetical protein
MVIGVVSDSTARAYPFQVVIEEGVINDRVGGDLVVVTHTDDGTLITYDWTVRGEALSFEAARKGRPKAGGSVWERASGRAANGPHEEMRLDRASDCPAMF